MRDPEEAELLQDAEMLDMHKRQKYYTLQMDQEKAKILKKSLQDQEAEMLHIIEGFSRDRNVTHH